VSAEITYGIERITMFIQRRASVYDIDWAPGITYGEIRHPEEVEHSRYGFEVADVAMLQRWFDDAEREATRLLDAGLVLPAYDYVLKCSHLFNLLEARGAVGAAERTGLMTRSRALARQVAERYVARRDELGHPLMNAFTRPAGPAARRRPRRAPAPRIIPRA
jgi:glycyl-tRNA synthetase alpha chain